MFKFLFKSVFWIISTVVKLGLNIIPSFFKLGFFFYKWFKRMVIAFLVIAIVWLWKRSKKK